MFHQFVHSILQGSLGALSEKSNSLQSSQEHPTNLRSHDQSHDHSIDSSSESDHSDLDRTLKDDSANVPSNLLEDKRLQMKKIGSSTEDDSDFSTTGHNHISTRTNQIDDYNQVDNQRPKAYQEETKRLETNQNQINPNLNNSGSNYPALDDPRVLRLGQEQIEDSEDGDDDVDEEEEAESDSIIEIDKKQPDDLMDQSDEVEEAEEDVAKKSAAVTSSHALNVDFEDEESWGDFGNAISGDEDSDDDDSIIVAGLPVTTSTPPVSTAKGW